MDEALAETMAAFRELSTERYIGQWAGQIPRSKVRDYGIEHMRLDGDELERFCSIIAGVDDDYLSMIAPKRDDGLRDIAPANDPQATKRILRNVAKKPRTKTL